MPTVVTVAVLVGILPDLNGTDAPRACNLAGCVVPDLHSFVAQMIEPPSGPVSPPLLGWI